MATVTSCENTLLLCPPNFCCLVMVLSSSVIAKHLRFGHQEDAHEFLRYVIDGIQKSCLAADGYTEK